MKSIFKVLNGVKKQVPGILKRKPSFPKKKVLVLEGGGMRGIFLVGVLQAFAERNYFPWKLVVGSSAGALTGAAYLAGLAVGVWRSPSQLADVIHRDRLFAPNMDKQKRDLLYQGWQDAVARTLSSAPGRS